MTQPKPCLVLATPCSLRTASEEPPACRNTAQARHRGYRAECQQRCLAVIVSIDLRKIDDVRSGVCLRQSIALRYRFAPNFLALGISQDRRWATGCHCIRGPLSQRVTCGQQQPNLSKLPTYSSNVSSTWGYEHLLVFITASHTHGGLRATSTAKPDGGRHIHAVRKRSEHFQQANSF